MEKRRYPTVFLVAFCAGCVVLATLARAVVSHDAAPFAVAAVGWVFIIGLLGFQIRAGWMRQKDAPRTFAACALFLVAAIAATAVAAWLAAITGSKSWMRLPTGIVALLGIGVAADCTGALCRMMTQKPNPRSQGSLAPPRGSAP